MKLPEFPSATISLYEFTLTLGLPLLAIAQENIFIFILYLGLISKQIPSVLLKRWIQNPRPDEAMNCSITNTGGSAKGQNGFPSAHTMFATFIFVYTLYVFIQTQKEEEKSLWGVLVVTGLFCILMPIARVHIKCHTIPQVIGGFIFGVLWAGLYILFEKYVLEKWPRYVADKNRFIRSFMST